MYDLIMLDFSMPNMDGPTAATTILKAVMEAQKKQLSLRNSQPRIKKPFICCVTAYTDPAHQKVALDAGMNLFVSKPLLQATMRRILSEAGILQQVSFNDY